MKTFSVSLVAVLLFVTAVSTAAAITIDDFYVHYKFDETSGTAFTDSGPNAGNADFYRAYKFNELPSIDVSNIVTHVSLPTSKTYIGLGTRSVGGVDNQVMVDIPVPTDPSYLPSTGDSFAVSFWASTDSWTDTYGLLASYNLNGLEWSIGLHSSGDSIVAWTHDADTSGTSYAWEASCATLPVSTFAHFVVQFEGTSGVTNLYINGVESTDVGNRNFWGNEREGFTLGGRVLDARNYTVPYSASTGGDNNTQIDDFAIIDGVVTTADVADLMDSTKGPGATSFDGRRLAYYAMDDLTGTQITDSSANANHGTLVGYDPATMGSAVRDLAPASRSGVFGNGVEIAGGFNERGILDAADLPERGDAFTVCFWAKPDENLIREYGGWDSLGVVLNWSNDPTPLETTDTNDMSDPDGLGFSVAFNTEGDGSLIVRRTSGNYTSSVDQDVYGVYLGESGSGLDLDPTVFHHFAVTVDATGDITGIYVDGNYIAQEINNGNGITDEGTAIIGGRSKFGNMDSALSGYLDDLAVISGVLTEAQIQYAMTNGVAALIGFVPPLYGDANGDGKVDAADVSIMAANWGATDATWAMGDFSENGTVGPEDAKLLAQNWGTGGNEATSAVPEPSILIMLLSLLGLTILRRRHG